MASTAVGAFVSVEEYLKTAYRPDVDYVDGQIEERNLGEYDHGQMILALAKYIDRHKRDWKVRIALDTRMRVSPTRYRVPDLSLQSTAAPKEQILHTPPLLCIEVLSPEDTFRKMRKRVEDYLRLGVGCVWILEYDKRTVTLCLADGGDTIYSAGVIGVPGTEIAVPLQEIFTALDED